MLRRDALRHEILGHRDGARRRQFPVRREFRRVDRPLVGVAIDAQHPVYVLGDLAGQVLDHARELAQFRLAFRRNRGFAGTEQHFGLEHEPVAHHAHIRAAFQHRPELAEEIRTVTAEVLHALRKGDVQPAAEVGNLRLALRVLGLRGLQRLLERADLLAQRGQLLVEQCHLRLCLARQVGLLRELRVEVRDFGILARDAGASPRNFAREPVSLECRRRKRRLQRGEVGLEIAGIGLFELQQVAQLRDLRVEPRHRRVLAADLLPEKELAQHEQREQENDHQQEARQGIDEARPVIGHLRSA